MRFSGYDTLARKKGEIAMIKRLFLICMVAAVVISLGCAKTEDKVAARIGETMITVGDLKGEYLAMSREARPILRTIEEKEQFAKDVVSKEILVMEAQKAGLDRMPEVIEGVQAEMKQKAWQAYYDDKVRSQIDITDDDLRALYAKQRYRYHLAWIFLRSGALADEISKRIKAGEDFATLAGVYSLDTSKSRGGDIGQRALGTMPDNVEARIMEMAPGEISEPIPYDGYYVLVNLLGKEEMEQRDFETSRTGLMSMERMRRESGAQRELARQVRQRYGLSFNDEAVELIAARTRQLHSSGPVEPGQLPMFSDEELARVVATYQGGEWQIRKYLESIKQQQGLIAPGPGADTEAIESLLGDFVTGELWMYELSGGQYETRPDVKNAIDRAQEELIVTAMHSQVIKDVKVDDEKLRDFYEENKAELLTEPEAELAFIFLATEEDAESVYQALNGGRRFGDLARERSIDELTGPNGGELPRPMTERQLEQFPELGELVQALSEGAHSKPMPVPPGFGPEGFMVVKILDKIEARQMEFEEVKRSLSDRVLEMEQEMVFGEWLANKMAGLEVEIYPDALGAINFEELREQED
jgi:parvulin-like peptidyl-prolyl isomerase